RQPDESHLSRRGAWTLALVAIQIVLGAWGRRWGAGQALFLHAIGGAAGCGHVVALAGRVLKRRGAHTELVPAALTMLIVATVPVALGVLSWWVRPPLDRTAHPVWPAQALVRIAHQGLGALLLASAITLTMGAIRRLQSPERVSIAKRLQVAEALA